MTQTMVNEGAPDAASRIRNDYPWLAKYPETVDWFAELKGEPLPDILDRTVRDYGNLTCTYFMGATMKYKEIGALADKAAKGLQELGRFGHQPAIFADAVSGRLPARTCARDPSGRPYTGR
jgi:hypothetical protein